jgi:hypothetical protein
MGAEDSATVRPWRRVPVTMTSRISPVAADSSVAPVGFSCPTAALLISAKADAVPTIHIGFMHGLPNDY